VLLATAVHIVFIVSKVAVLAFAAIELVPLPTSVSNENIVAIPAIEDIRSRARVQKVVGIPAIEDIIALARVQYVVAVASVEHVIARAVLQIVVAWPSVEHVFTQDRVSPLPRGAPQPVLARPAVDGIASAPSDEVVFSSKAAYLVIAFTPVQLIGAVGA